ncbi:guanylate kinase [Bacillus phage vB_BpuM-BpSp]|nr:guanylate kinase [Bacillus phage vB_BpuM-BpSp]
MRKKLLVIAGPSGCGKNYMTDLLVKEHGNWFKQMPQYTTRAKRTPDENTYYFVDKLHFKLIEDKLIAKTEIHGDFYGTLPTMQDNKIGIVIANKLGIENLKRTIDENNYQVFYLGIDSEIPVKREDRDETYVEKERQGLKDLMDTWLVSKEDRFLTADDIVKELIDKDFLF